MARTVIGEHQARAYCRETKRKYTLTSSGTRYKFFIGTQTSLGTLIIRIPISESFLNISIYVVTEDLPLPIGHDIIDQYHITVDASRIRLINDTRYWTLQLSREDGQLFYRWRTP